MIKGFNRIEKFKSKLDGTARGKMFDLQKEEMVKKQKVYFDNIVQLETKVKQICNGRDNIMNQYFYLIFARELYKLNKKHKDETLLNEICIYLSKWQTRGLDEAILTDIKNLITLGECLIPMFCNTYPYRMKLTFSGNVSTTDLDNFPILIVLDNTNFNFNHAKADGTDIRFSADNCITTLDYEIEHWDKPNEKAFIWVRIPKITANTNTEFIYMFFGDLTACDGQNIIGTWNANFLQVQHLQELATPVLDSTSNNNDMNVIGAVSTPNGKIDNAYYWDGNADQITRTPPVVVPNSYSVEFWLKPDDYTNSTGLVMNKNQFAIINASVGKIYFKDLKVIVDRVISANFIGDNNWHHYVCTTDSSVLLLYRDGINWPKGITAGGIGQEVTNTLIYNARPNVNQWGKGNMDEVRIINYTLTPDWILADFNTQNNTFLTYGAEEKP